MRVSPSHGALAGLVGGAAMLLVVAVPSAAGRALPLDITRFWRGVLGRPRAALLGHAALSAAVGVVLGVVAGATLDDTPTAAATIGLGLGFGAVHAAIALGVLPLLLRRFPATLDPATVVGRWGTGLGAVAIGTAVAAHLTYGVTGALAYRALVG